MVGRKARRVVLITGGVTLGLVGVFVLLQIVFIAIAFMLGGWTFG